MAGMDTTLQAKEDDAYAHYFQGGKEKALIAKDAQQTKDASLFRNRMHFFGSADNKALYGASFSADDERDEIENAKAETSANQRPTLYPVASLENQAIPREQHRQSTFENVMDTIAFPERHMPSLLAFSNNRKTKVGTSADQRPTLYPVASLENQVISREQHRQSTFENVMDTIAFPERHMPSLLVFPNKCKPSLRALDNPSCESIMDSVAFPEKHLNCQSLNAPTTMGENVFIPESKDGNAFRKQPVEAEYDGLDHQNSIVYVKRDSSLISSSALPRRGDILVVEDEDERMVREHLLPRRTRSNVSNEEEGSRDSFSNEVEQVASNGVDNETFSDTQDKRVSEWQNDTTPIQNNDSHHGFLDRDRSLINQRNSFYDLALPSDYDPIGLVNRDRSLISESSVSTVPVPDSKQKEGLPKNQGLELVLSPDDPTCTSRHLVTRVRRPNLLSRFLSVSRSSSSPSSNLRAKQSGSRISGGFASDSTSSFQLKKSGKTRKSKNGGFTVIKPTQNVGAKT